MAVPKEDLSRELSMRCSLTPQEDELLQHDLAPRGRVRSG